MKNIFTKITAGILLFAILFTCADMSIYEALASQNEETHQSAAVAASGGAITASPSAIVYVKNTKIKSVMPGKKSVKLKLTSSGKGKISGFVVYKKNSKGSWKLKKTIKKKKATYEDTDVSFGKTYAYRARAYYKDKESKTHYGKYSKAVKVKVTVHEVHKKVTDKNSALYGKTLLMYRYGDGSAVSDNSKYCGKISKYEIYVSKRRQYATVYGIKGKYLVPLKAFVISSGRQVGWTPEGTFYTKAKYRWHLMSGGVYCQWLTRITGSYLFHSECYRTANNKSLLVNGYNRLGSVASHGCVRLQAGNAKWIYDHCPVGTKVVIHSKGGYEPMKKPSVSRLPLWHNWDPTDPTAQKYCKQHKCHRYAKK